MPAEMIEITLDGRKLLVEPGRTILEVAESQGVKIPTLCHDRRLEPYASCWVCLVKVEKAKGFVPSCGTRVASGMVVTTSSPDVLAARKMALELLLSSHYGDCKAPCTLTCPSNIDIQGYLGLAANGRFAEAAELIRRDNPMPAVIGRVCPHPCEEACRRALVDEPLAINNVKRFLADVERGLGATVVKALPPRIGKNVAVVGAGPAGLSAAWYLGAAGVDVTVYEAMDKAGGMLRYGIPDYRLPPEVLDESITGILGCGAVLRTGVRLGKDVTLDGLRRDFDAVVLAIGAWKSRALRIPGEDHPAVLSGIEFLQRVNAHEKVTVGRRTAVIGGGNTALDAARCSLRCGAEEVAIYYRRTREEMPASDAEIEEALEEGIRVEYLAAPVSVQAEGTALKSLTLLKMALGEPDASGRRRPVPVEGSEYTVAVDTVISAVGQYPDAKLLSGLDGLVDARGDLAADRQTGATGVAGVFAAGDLLTGTDIAIRAIAGGKHAARSVLSYFEGRLPSRPKEFLSKKEDLRTPVAADFAHVARAARAKPVVAGAETRRRSYDEIERTLPRAQVQLEAARCLECGCHDVKECRLKEQAGDCDAVAKRFLGDVVVHPVDDTHPFISRDPSKCVLCGRCVRICLEVQGIGVLGYLYRGFTSLVAPSFGVPFGTDGTCISCGQCVSACPVGALTEKVPAVKNVPLDERAEEGVCTLCSVGCGIEYRWHGSLLTRVLERWTPPNRGKLCRKGKFGHAFLNEPAGTVPLDAAGRPLASAEASSRAGRMLRSAKHPVMRVSGRLCAEAIDAFLDLAARRRIPVEGEGLAGVDPRWARFVDGAAAGRSDGGCVEPGRGLPVRILVGDVAAANNVVFTEAYRERRERTADLWIVGVDAADPASVRAASRLEPSLGALPGMLADAMAGAVSAAPGSAAPSVTVFVNPVELLKSAGIAGEKAVLDALERAVGPGTGSIVRVVTLWNDRNAGYLFGRIASGHAAPKRPDLVLDVGAGTSPDGAAIIAWGLSPRAADLYLPLPREYWIAGRMHPSGGNRIVVGEVDAEGLRSSLPQG
jgi:formate dehydrogenase major subunit